MIVWLNAHLGPLSVIASVVSALAATVVMLATLSTVTLNRRLAKENRTLRKAENDPQVVAYAAMNPLVWAALDFVIANIGKGPARNVSYKVLTHADLLAAKKVHLLPTSSTFAFLPSGEKLSSAMGMGWDLLSDPKLPPFEVEVSYENLSSEKRRTTFVIDVTQFDGMHRLGTPNDEEIANNLKKIASTMEGWATRRLQVETMSVTERAEHDAQVRQIMDERRARDGGLQSE